MLGFALLLNDAISSSLFFWCALLATCDFAFDWLWGSSGLMNSKTGMTSFLDEAHGKGLGTQKAETTAMHALWKYRKTICIPHVCSGGFGLITYKGGNE